MSGDEIRELKRAEPFRPFTIAMAHGRRVPVLGPDYFLVSPSGRSVDVFQRDDSLDMLDVASIVEIAIDLTDCPAQHLC